MSSPKISSNNKKKTKKENPRLMVFLSGLSGISNEKGILSYLRSRVRGVIGISFPKKPSSGYAFVTMKDEAAKQQILRAKNLKYKKRELKAKEFLSGSKLSKFKSTLNNRRLFVCSLPVSTKDSELIEFFSEFGEVETAYLIRDRITKKPKSFGYVLYKDVETAREVAGFKSIRFKRKKIKVQIHQGKSGAKSPSDGNDSRYIKKTDEKGQIPFSEKEGKNPKNRQTSKIGSGSSQSSRTEKKKSGRGKRRSSHNTNEFLRKETPSIIEASRGGERQQNQSSDFERSENSIEEKMLRVRSGTPPLEEFNEKNHTREIDLGSPKHHHQRKASADERVGTSGLKVSKLRPNLQNDREGSDEVSDSKKNEASPESDNDKKSENRELTHSLRPTNSAYFPERAEIFKERLSKGNYRNNVEYRPSRKTGVRTYVPTPYPGLSFRNHTQRYQSHSGWPQYPMLASRYNY